MRRRDLLAGLLATATASALRAAEPNKVYRVAVCTQFGMDRFSAPGGFFPHFFDRMRQLGYIEGNNLIADRYAAEKRPERYPEIARSAVQAKPDVIVVSFDNQLISLVANETSTIPIVANFPSLAAGFVHNIARPEGNITGVTGDAGIEMQGKHLDILRQAVPSASRVAYLSNRYDWDGVWGHAVVEAGRQAGISIIGTPMEHWEGDDDYHQAFETMARQSADALMVNGMGGNFIYRDLIADLALKYRLPSIGWFADVVENGHGLMSYAPDYSGLPGRMAELVDQILKGTKVADIPINQPSRFILTINLKTAKALGLQIPDTLIAQADKVIE